MTGVDVTQQLFMMFRMTGFGITAMFLLTFANEIVRRSKWNKRKQAIADFVTIIFCGMLFCAILIAKNNGAIRSYIFLGLLIGVLGYYLFFQRYCQKICAFAAKYVLICGRIISKMLLTPWRLCSRYIFQRIKKKRELKKQRKLAAQQANEELEKNI